MDGIFHSSLYEQLKLYKVNNLKMTNNMCPPYRNAVPLIILIRNIEFLLMLTFFMKICTTFALSGNCPVEQFSGAFYWPIQKL